MAARHDPNAVFEAAYQSFLHSLPENERSQYSPCASAADLVHGLQKLDTFAKRGQRRRHTRFLSVIGRFGDKIEPFFDVINIFIQSKPEYSAIVWGSLRLVLQLASNYTTFFEKLMRIIERLVDSLPQYADVAALCKSTPSLSLSASSRMETHLEKVYTDLLLFFQSTARVFSSGQGRIRKTPAVICDLMWTPFDTRFKDLLEQMESHRNMIRYEIEILQAQVLCAAETSASWERRYATEERKLAEEERIRAQGAAQITYDMKLLLEKEQQDSIFERVHAWLRPSDFNEVLETSQEIREEGTCEWIFENLEFDTWKSLEWSLKPPSNSKYLSPNFVWFQGNPGYGKTVLASHVIEILQDELCAPDSNTEMLYYFFRSNRDNATTAASAWRAILSQMLSTHRTDNHVLEKFAFAKDENSVGQLSASPVELTSLLQCCLSGMQRVYLILDGVDECDDTAALMQLLVWMGANTGVKVLLFSRPNVGKLQKMIPKAQRITVDRCRTSADIEKFLKHQLQVLVEEELLSATADLSELVKRLVIGADGMFLWARLMINHLESPALTPKARLRVVLDVVLPEGLEGMYDRILRLIYRGSRAEQDLARRVFLWIAYALRPLNIQGLHAVLTAEDDISHENDVTEEVRTSSLKSLKETIVTICGGLVEIVTQEPASAASGSFRFVHLSVKEHFLRLSSSVKIDEAFQSVFPSHESAHFELASRCVEEVSGDTHLTYGEHWQQQDLTRYATAYWTDHLVHAVPAQVRTPLLDSAIQQGAISRLVSSLTHFLDNSRAIKRWIHSCYCDGNLSLGVVDLGSRNIEIWVGKISSLESRTWDLEPLKRLSRLIREFVHDLKLLKSSWGSKLSLDPELIWDEVPAFVKSQFLVSDGTTTYSLASSKPRLAKSSKNPLSIISRTTRDGLLNGALSIWPVQEFEEHWQSLGADYQHSTYQLCDGWVAKYEVWTLNQELCRLVDVTLPLTRKEVNLLLRQSFRGDGEGWKSSFPLAISDDLHSVIVLRTLYFFDLATGSTPAKMQSAFIELDFAETLRPKWQEDAQAFDMEKTDIQSMPLTLKYMHTMWYYYNFTFGPRGDFLAFSDYLHNSFGQQHLAIYKVYRKDVLSVKLINWAEFSVNKSLGSTIVKSVLRVVFHPTYDIVVFERNGTINLWNFQENFRDRTITQNKDYEGYLVEFSDCGNYVLFSKQGLPTTVWPVPPQLFSRAQQSPKGGIIPQPLSTEGVDLVAGGNADTSALQLHDGQVLQSSQLIPGQDNQILASTSVTAKDSIDISFQRHGSSPATQVIKIITLPQQYEASNIVPTIKMPENGNTSIRVILDRISRSDYSMEDIQNQSRLVIDRPLNKIKQTVYLSPSSEPLTESSKKRSRPLYTDPRDYRISATGDDELATHAFDVPGQIIADVGSLDARRDAKRLRQTLHDQVIQPGKFWIYHSF